jgi:hypothetical protein
MPILTDDMGLPGDFCRFIMEDYGLFHFVDV